MACDLKIEARRKSPFSFYNKCGRCVWNVVWLLLFRPSPRYFRGWRRFLLLCFGAKISPTAAIYPGVKIWAPWLIEIGDNTGIADGVVLYSQDWIRIGARVVISQETYVCAGTHDYSDSGFRLITKPIVICDDVWVAARAFIHCGVVIGSGAVVGACSVVSRDLPAWTVCAGNPCKPIKPRILC
jgi:putative colanic acid biosynthesis acetyltransferase WcaF